MAGKSIKQTDFDELRQKLEELEEKHRLLQMQHDNLQKQSRVVEILEIDAILAQLAADLRTPLLTLHNTWSGSAKYLDDILCGYSLAVDKNLISKPIRKHILESLKKRFAGAGDEVAECNKHIDKALDKLRGE